MAREIFGPGIFRGEGKTIEQIDKKRKRETKSKTTDWWEDEKQEQEDLERLHEEATAKYEGMLGTPPPEDWTTEQIVTAMDKRTLKEQRESKMSGSINNKRAPIYEGKIDATDKTIHRGHRHGEKPRKPGRETRRKEIRKEAA